MRISRQPSDLQIMIDRKQLEVMEHFNCLCNVITNDTVYTSGIKSTIAIAETEFNNMILFTRKIGLQFKASVCIVLRIGHLGKKSEML